MSTPMIASITERNVRYHGSRTIWLDFREYMGPDKRQAHRHQLIVNIDLDDGRRLSLVMNKLLPMEWHPDRSEVLSKKNLSKMNPKGHWLRTADKSHVVEKLNDCGSIVITGKRTPTRHSFEETFELEVRLPIYIAEQSVGGYEVGKFMFCP